MRIFIDMKKRFGIIIIMMAVIFALLLTGCFGGQAADETKDPNATIEPQQDSKAAFKLYDKGNGFTIKYQNNWVVIYDVNDRTPSPTATPEGEGPNEVSEVVFAAKSADAEVMLYPSVTVMKIKLSEDEKKEFDLKKYAQKSLEDVQANVKNFSIFKATNEEDIQNVVLGIDPAENVKHESTAKPAATTAASGTDAVVTTEMTVGTVVETETEIETEVESVEVTRENIDNTHMGYTYTFIGEVYGVSDVITKQVIAHKDGDDFVYILTYIITSKDYAETEYDFVANKTLESFIIK